MVKKLSSGDYECKHCGNIIGNYKKALGHEGVCADSKLAEYLDNIGQTTDLEIKGFETSETKQIKLGETMLGRCGNCSHAITTKNRFKDMNNMFECPRCEKIINKNK